MTNSQVLEAQEKLARRRRSDRLRRAGMTVTVLSLVATAVSIAVAGDLARFAKGSVICGSLLVLGLLTMAWGQIVGWRAPDLKRAEAQLASAQETLWELKVKTRPLLDDRRRLYREEVVSVIEQYQADSRKYRRVHNSLQSLIMIGSAATTTIAALDTGKELTWQSVTLTLISFAITLAAMFTGYYKFRERSYFLQQTADAIEEEANAVTLGIGPYADYGSTNDQQQQALKLFTQRVEDHRNEQRRRQQQLDQPADQTPPTAAPPQT